MNNMYRKILAIIITLIILLLTLASPTFAVTASEKQELIELLNEYQGDLGNLIEFKLIVDKTYEDLHSTSTVDESLKNTLREDIDMLDTVSDLNPLILTVLKVELNSQVDSLTNSNLHEMQEEIEVIKEWSDQKALELGYTGNTETPNANENVEQLQPTETIVNQGIGTTNSSLLQDIQQVATSLPNTGISRIISFAIIFLIISAIVSIIRYKQLKIR